MEKKKKRLEIWSLVEYVETFVIVFCFCDYQSCFELGTTGEGKI